MKRLLALLLCLVLALSLIPAAAAEDVEIVDVDVSDDDLIPIVEIGEDPAEDEPLTEELRPVSNGDVAINADNFPDDAFRALVSDEFDLDGDGYLDPNEKLSATALYFDASEIASLQGIEYLTYLEELVATNEWTEGLLTEVDLSANRDLTIVNLCFNPGLTSLDVSALWKLRELNVGFSGISELDLRYNDQLRALWINDAAFTDVNLTHNKLLEQLDVCGNENLSFLDIHACPSLVSDFLAGGRHLAWMQEISQQMYESIVVYGGEGDGGMDDHDYHLAVNTDMIVLAELPINDTIFPDPIFRGIVADSFDSDGDGNLSPDEIAAATELTIYDRGIVSLRGVEYLTNLEKLDCSANELTALDVSNNLHLFSLDVGSNNLGELDLSGNPYLGKLFCPYCSLAELDVSALPNLMLLACYGNGLSELDLSCNPYLEELMVQDTGLLALDVSNNEILSCLDVSGCHNLSVLDLSNNRWLEDLYTYGSGVEQLSLGYNPCVSSAYLFGEKTTVNGEDRYVIDNDYALYRLHVSPGTEVLAETRCGDNAVWSFLDGTLTISGSGATWDVLGSTGYQFLAHDIRSVVIKEGIEKVGSRAFDTYYFSIEAISFPSTLRIIGDCSFRHSDVTSLTFPASLETIVGWAFEGATLLRTIRFLGSAPDLNYCCFNEVTATVYYPADDPTWTEAKIQDYYINHHINGEPESVEEGFLTWIGITKPVITTQPESKTAEAGTTVKFTVAATGGDLSYQWQYRKSSSDSWHNSGSTGNKTATLILTATDARNGFQFRCRVKNPAGTSYSKAATLTVGEKPAITTQPASRTAAAGTTVKFKVVATGAESYQWQYRKSSSGTWYNSTGTGNKTATLSVEATAARNGFQFRCKVTNAVGTTNSSAATLTVTAGTKPAITTQPTSKTVNEGSTAKFTVAATGAESYQWQYRKSASDSWHNSTGTGNKTATLSIQGTAARNGFQFRCKVTNAAGTTTSSAATLTVRLKPVITTQPTDKTVTAGTTVKFKVVATGAETYQWQYRKSASGSWYNSTGTGNKTATLTLTATEARNGFQFRCKIINEAGTTYTRIVTLTVK